MKRRVQKGRSSELDFAPRELSLVLLPLDRAPPQLWPVPSDSPLSGELGYPCGFQHHLCSGSSSVRSSSSPASRAPLAAVS